MGLTGCGMTALVSAVVRRPDRLLSGSFLPPQNGMWMRLSYQRSQAPFSARTEGQWKEFGVTCIPHPVVVAVMPADETIEVDPKTKAVLDKKGYQVLKKISEGSFGKVYKAVKDGENYAVKTMDLRKMEQKGLTGKFLDREIIALINVRHPNVLKVSYLSRLRLRIDPKYYSRSATSSDPRDGCTFSWSLHQMAR